MRNACVDLVDRGLEPGGDELREATRGELTVQMGTKFVRDLVWSKRRNVANEKFVIFTVNHMPELAWQAVPEVFEFEHLSTVTSKEWERFDRGRFFDVSKGVTKRIRHGDHRASIPMLMDSAGWVLARDALCDLRKQRSGHCQNASLLDLLVVTITGPKSRLQMGAWSVNGRLDGSSELFIRANQGHDLRFVREERVAKSCRNLDVLRDSIEDLWHVTREDNLDGILRKGLLPGGARSSRNSVYLSSVSPWVDGFKAVTREYCSVFVRVDPVKLSESVPSGSIMQTANGTVLVRSTIPPRALVCVLVRRPGSPNFLQLWHRDVADQPPSSSGPSCRTGTSTWNPVGKFGGIWIKSANEKRGRPSTACLPSDEGGTDRGDVFPACVDPPLVSPWLTSQCQACGNEFVTGTVECLRCGSIQFYPRTNAEAQEIAKDMAAEAARRRAEMEAATRAEAEAEVRLKEEKNLLRAEGCRFSHRESVENSQRQRVRKAHLHRRTWISTGGAADEFRKKNALEGYVAISASSNRTSPWTPTSPDDIPHGEVAVLPQDVVYCMLSYLMDDVGLPLKGDPLNDTIGKRLADSLIAVLVDHDFEKVSDLILGCVDECVAWLIDA